LGNNIEISGMLYEELQELPSNRAIVLDNRTCAYCGSDFGSMKRTKEHVVGRRFVPKGSLDGEWNLIVQACARCNAAKGLLENEISAVTLFGHGWTDRFRDDSITTREGLRKAKAKSSVTGRSVGDSIQTLRLKARLGEGLSLTMSMEGPPPISDDRLYGLAQLHIRALFYFVTYRENEKIGRFWRGPFIAVGEARRANWGNVRLRAFADAVVQWEPRFRGFTAKDHFGAIIRKHPSAPCWSWALEWNKHYRMVGFFGDEEIGAAIAQGLPQPKFDAQAGDANNGFALVLDVPLAEKDDHLFGWNIADLSDSAFE
jgi:hypothetical protein